MVDPPRKRIPFPSLKRSRFPGGVVAGGSIRIIRIIPGLSLLSSRACLQDQSIRRRKEQTVEFYDDLNFLLKNYSTTLWRPSSPIIFALGFHQDSFAHSRPVGAAVL